MPITVHSPFSGREVKIRDQDVGRAVRDEENRIFYVIERADGSGHYGAPTRSGNPRDEVRYDELVAKMATTKASGQANSVAQIHDATGKPRANLLVRVVVLILVLAVVAGAFLYLSGNLNQWLGGDSLESPLKQLPLPSAPALPDMPTPTPTSQLWLTQPSAQLASAWSQPVGFYMTFNVVYQASTGLQQVLSDRSIGIAVLQAV